MIKIIYKDKFVEQPITVETRKLVEVYIAIDATKLNYIEGEDFDSNGLIIKGKYNDGTEEILEEYEILEGKNLKVNQEKVILKNDII